MHVKSYVHFTLLQHILDWPHSPTRVNWGPLLCFGTDVLATHLPRRLRSESEIEHDERPLLQY